MADHYPVTWVLMRVNGEQVYGGFCGKTQMLYTLSTRRMLDPLLIQDLIVTQNHCEEGEGCLYQSCPLNRTTPASYWKRHGLKGPPPGKPIGAFAHGVELPTDLRRGRGGGIITDKDYGPVLELDNRPKTTKA